MLQGLEQFGAALREVLADEVPRFHEVLLVLAVDEFSHAAGDGSCFVVREDFVPVTPHTTLITFQPEPRKIPSSS